MHSIVFMVRSKLIIASDASIETNITVFAAANPSLDSI